LNISFDLSQILHSSRPSPVEVHYAGIKTADGKSVEVAGHQVTAPDLACMANIDPDSHSGGAKCRYEENDLLVEENDLIEEEIDLLTR